MMKTNNPQLQHFPTNTSTLFFHTFIMDHTNTTSSSQNIPPQLRVFPRQRYSPVPLDPNSIPEETWQAMMALNQEQKDIADASELLSDKSAYPYVYQQTDQRIPTATFPLDVSYRWQNTAYDVDALSEVIVLLNSLVRELREPNSNKWTILDAVSLELMTLERTERHLRTNCTNGEKEAVGTFL